MASLGEEVEAAEGLDVVAPGATEALDEEADVTGLGVDVTANVDDTTGTELAQLGEEVGAGTLAGRVDDDHGLVRREGDVGEQLVGVCSNEARVGHSVALGVQPRRLDPVGVHVDAQHRREQRRQRHPKQPGPAVRVQQVLDPRRPVLHALGRAVVPHVLDEFRQDRVVVLEERVGHRPERKLPHVLGRHRPVVRRVCLGVHVRRVCVGDPRLPILVEAQLAARGLCVSQRDRCHCLLLVAATWVLGFCC